jgi:hypothetical protein
MCVTEPCLHLPSHTQGAHLLDVDASLFSRLETSIYELSLICVSDVLFYVVYTEPRDIGWREVAMSCVEDDTGR